MDMADNAFGSEVEVIPRSIRLRLSERAEVVVWEEQLNDGMTNTGDPLMGDETSRLYYCNRE